MKKTTPTYTYIKQSPSLYYLLNDLVSFPLNNDEVEVLGKACLIRPRAFSYLLSPSPSVHRQQQSFRQRVRALQAYMEDPERLKVGGRWKMKLRHLSSMVVLASKWHEEKR